MKTNKKGTGNSSLLMWVAVIALGALTLNQLGYLPGKQAVATGTTTTTTGGQVVTVAPIEAVNPSDTVSLQVVLKNDGLKGINDTYMQGNATVLLNGAFWKTVEVARTASGGSITGIPVNKPFSVILQGGNSATDAGGDTFYLTSKDYPTGLKSGDTLSLYVLPYAEATIQAKNITAGEGSSGLGNSVDFGGNITSNTFEEFELRAQGAAYSGFGSEGVVVACNRLGVQYDVKTSMTKTTLSSQMAQANKKIAYLANVQRVGDNVVTIGTIGFSLKSGQTEAPINCTGYDVGKFKKLGGIAIGTGTEMDDTSNSDVGAGQFSIVFGSATAADINT